MDGRSELRKRRIVLAWEAARRWEATKQARGAVLTEIAKKGPLGAETAVRARKFERRERIRVAVNLTQGRRPLFPGQERVIGATLDLRDLPSGEPAERAGQPVARLIDAPAPGIVPQGFGTGFLVSPRLLITNNHVFPDKGSAKAIAHFGYEHDLSALHAGTMFELDPDLLFLTDTRLDFSLVAVKPRSLDGNSLQQFGCLPLIATTGKILMGQPVSIIQYPMGGPKQWAETENKLLFINDEMPYMQYETDTLPGSSGSPVYNSFWEVVALHHSGVPRVENGQIMTKTGTVWNEATMTDDEIDWVANEGVRVSSLVEFIKAQTAASPGGQDLLKELIAGTADPLEKKAAQPTEIGGGIVMPALPTGPATLNVIVNGTANFYTSSSGPLPVPAPLPPVAIPVTPALEKKLRFDPKYPDRPGYSDTFLGVHIPLPTVASARAAELLTDGTQPIVLKYHHYSLVMNKERKLMMWSAANVDYSDDKRPVTGRDEFGTDDWKPDPRIPGQFQLEDAEFYAPAKKFDRGHILRREDNAWGDSPTLQEFANSDTFHWTNCTPQHEAFNRSTSGGIWGQLENHITTQAAGVQAEKLVIFAGPVLDPNDLEHDFGSGIVKVPIRFWKIVTVKQKTGAGSARLASFGFVLDQSTAIRVHGLEAFEVGKFKTFQRSLADISNMTGVVFPNVLLNADVKKNSPGSHPLESLQDLQTA